MTSLLPATLVLDKQSGTLLRAALGQAQEQKYHSRMSSGIIPICPTLPFPYVLRYHSHMSLGTILVCPQVSFSYEIFSYERATEAGTCGGRLHDERTCVNPLISKLICPLVLLSGYMGD